MPIVITNKMMLAIWMITCYGDEVFNFTSNSNDYEEDADAVNKGDNRNWLTWR